MLFLYVMLGKSSFNKISLVYFLFFLYMILTLHSLTICESKSIPDMLFIKFKHLLYHLKSEKKFHFNSLTPGAHGAILNHVLGSAV